MNHLTLQISRFHDLVLVFADWAPDFSRLAQMRLPR
jgi:hypothetical protein